MRSDAGAVGGQQPAPELAQKRPHFSLAPHLADGPSAARASPARGPVRLLAPARSAGNVAEIEQDARA